MLSSDCEEQDEKETMLFRSPASRIMGEQAIADAVLCKRHHRLTQGGSLESRTSTSSLGDLPKK